MNIATKNCPATSRSEFFNGYWKAMEHQGWIAAILHTWSTYPERIESDVDYVVDGVGYRDLLRFLAKYSKGCGWRLLQIIEHESRAYYCVCMQCVPPYESLALDVTWEYRRLGHLLVPGTVLTRNVRSVPGKSFRVVSVGVEFCYILAKAAAKAKKFDDVRLRIGELLSEDADQCSRTAEEVFACDVPGQGRISNSLEQWEKWFSNAICFRKVRAGRRFGSKEVCLYVRRMRYPTGFRIRRKEGIDAREVRELTGIFSPLFRRIRVGCPSGAFDIYRNYLDVVRSTLLIEVDCAIDSGDLLGNTSPRELVEILAGRIDRRIERISG
jgi:hypothetical protein